MTEQDVVNEVLELISGITYWCSDGRREQMLEWVRRCAEAQARVAELTTEYAELALRLSNTAEDAKRIAKERDDARGIVQPLMERDTWRCEEMNKLRERAEKAERDAKWLATYADQIIENDPKWDAVAEPHLPYRKNP